MKFNKRVTAMVATAAAAAAFVPVVAAGPAHANACAGEQIRSFTHTNGSTGAVTAYTGIYRSSTQFCAVTVKQGELYGRQTRMELSLYGPGGSSADRGEFLYQAGPVRVPRNGACYHLDIALWNGFGSLVTEDTKFNVVGNC